MKHLNKYQIFNETRFISKPGLKGGMDVDTFNMVSEDIGYILADLKDEHYNFRTLLNNTESPTTEYTGERFSVEIYNQTKEGLKGEMIGRFMWDDVSEYVDRIYDYMVTEKWIGTWSPVVNALCSVDTGLIDEDGLRRYKHFSAGWDRFKWSIKEEHRELRRFKIDFTLGR